MLVKSCQPNKHCTCRYILGPRQLIKESLLLSNNNYRSVDLSVSHVDTVSGFEVMFPVFEDWDMV